MKPEPTLPRAVPFALIGVFEYSSPPLDGWASNRIAATTGANAPAAITCSTPTAWFAFSPDADSLQISSPTLTSRLANQRPTDGQPCPPQAGWARFRFKTSFHHNDAVTGSGYPCRAMLINFFYTLRAAKLPVSVKEYLTLLEAIRAEVIGPSVEDFYYLARTTLVKDEAHFDKFDRAFSAYFKGVELLADFTQDIPLEWLRKNLELELSPEDKAKIEKMGWDELMETLKKRFEEQKQRHEGGSKMIGTGGTSPFGAYGYNPQGIRIGQDKGRNRSAVKVWDQRAYKDYDDSLELGTRNIKVALRRLRRFAREGSELELDLDDTIHCTAANAGMLDIKMIPERHNKVKVLLLMDVGGTMDEHIHRVEELFSAAKSEFKHLEFYYFHNCVYDFMWKNNRRRYSEKFGTWDLIRKYNKDYKLIFVGDATMSPYEILQPGGSVEYNNEEPGAEWLQRLTNAFPKYAWINPEPQGVWQYRQSISIISQLMNQRMFPLTLAGLEGAMRLLSK
jgi:uncharacterized protein with von Willebrand factor type A (vWA) domain